MNFIRILALAFVVQAQPARSQTGVITGRIASQLGQPLANADVQAVKVGYKDGERVFVAVRSARTNDLGEYRLFWLPPGTYYVNALASGLRPFVVNAEATGRALFQLSADTEYPAKLPPLGRLGERESDVPIYFPGTSDGRYASPIRVGPAEEVRGIDIVALPVPTPRVRGTVVNDATGVAASGLQVVMAALNPVAGSPVSGYSTSVDPAGRFEIPRAVPGRYALVALQRNRLVARREVDVAFADVDVSIRIGSVLSRQGRIVGERPVNAGALVVALQPYPPLPPSFINSNVARAFQSVSSAPVGPDGTFELRQIPEGDYRLVIAQGLQASDAYLKSVRLGALDLLNNPLRVEQPTEDTIEVAFGRTPAAISGRTAAGATVVLVPSTDRSFRTDLFRFTSADSNGQFQLSGIPPGEYAIFAWETVEIGAWQDPAFLGLYEELGQVVRLDEGAMLRVDLTVIPGR